MDAKKLALLIGALVVAAVTAVMAKHMSNASSAPIAMAAAAAPTGPQVLVATRPLPVGTILVPDSFKFQPWPKDVIDGAYYVQGAAGVEPGKMAGWVVRNAITAGQPLTQGSLVSPGDRGFLAAALSPGMRAVTVAVSGASAVAGFVFPGDRVDVVLTEEIAASGDGSQSLKTAATILRNVRVLATDQRTDNMPTPDGKTAVSTFTMVTVEATPKLAEKIAVSQKLGSLSLSLRPLADDTQELERAIASGAVKVPAGSDPRAEKQMMLDIASRPQDSGTTFTTGGEVSRFARSTIPSQRPVGLGPATPNGATGGTAAAAPGGAPVVTGPVVRVSRGANVTAVPIGLGRGVAAAGNAISVTQGL